MLGEAECGNLHSGPPDEKEFAMSWNRTIGVIVACSTVSSLTACSPNLMDLAAGRVMAGGKAGGWGG
jgi:hypothetical protein